MDSKEPRRRWQSPLIPTRHARYELFAHDPTTPAGLAGIAGDLLVMFNHSQPCPCLSGLPVFVESLSRPVPPFARCQHDTWTVLDKVNSYPQRGAGVGMKFMAVPGVKRIPIISNSLTAMCFNQYPSSPDLPPWP